MFEFRDRVLEVLRDMEDWRPESEKGFDRNNWSNGYLPGCWGLMGGDVETFRERGTAYIDKLPSVTHWVRRSTNHGAVIYATYLVGAKALGEDLSHLDTLREIVRRAIGEQLYAEGINYLNFILSELLPLTVALWENEQDWRTFIAETFPGLDMAKRTLMLAAGLEGSVRFMWGDMSDLRVFQNGLRFADSLSDEGALIETLANQFKLPDYRLEPLVGHLPSGGSRPVPETVHFPNEFVVDKRGDTALWILGSKRQMTHNRAHDMASFLFENPRLFVGKRFGREAYKHNGILLSDAPGFPNCPGPDPFDRRVVDGRVERIGDGHWRAIAPRSYAGCPTRVELHVRDLHLVEDYLVVIDQVVVKGDGVPFVQFFTHELTALYDARHYEDRTICTMEKGRRAWLSAVAIGAEGVIKLKNGIRFRGRTFPTPPDRLELLRPRETEANRPQTLAET
ncbi:hypothetical protein [Sphingomicrobium clamense]|uniref:Heparin-sulfate lyase N-terminal domain-containing protein n=1 Tax=Sphingomicrobium clamense TaxID=2851013 RepID=A0ABS6V5G3_9SPHN|nr:hypothetical protein [Sphingomicrobium sp. B8]MBW0144812.1 hypothetical protein [Sphingomicrobium sp. B8]